MLKMQIRKCAETEIVAVGEFYDRIVQWLDNHINYPKWMYRIYPSESWAREMTEAGEQYVCVDNGKMVGVFVLNADPQGAYQKGKWAVDLPDGSYMVLHALAIDPELQSQGFGSQIIRFCVEKAKAEGFKTIRVDIVPGNDPARRLYEKNGFQYAGDVDLERGIEHIPVFSLYELNW
ncbi:MAG: GNAT family N-acetyltransferase [Schwartzia sp.]|nr:GNAT family N-acetyltransferase [Schwartzia sp. (in: firmicutes)]